MNTRQLEGVDGKVVRLLQYHLKIVQSGQPGTLVERRILCLREGLLHQFRVWPAQDRIDDSGIEIRPPRGGRSDVAAGILDAPTEKALHVWAYGGL